MDAIRPPETKRRTFVVTMGIAAMGIAMIVGAVLADPLAAEAQPAGKRYRIGVIVTSGPKESEHLVGALSEGLRELGYVEGRNLVLERRFAEGQQERLPALAAELVRLGVDVIVTGSNPVVAAVKQTTGSIPIVMALSRDPVAAGFIASLARPGGNITGLANDPGPEIHAKNLEILKEAVPRASRVAYLWNPLPPGAEAYRKVVEDAARRLGVKLQLAPVRNRGDLDRAFEDIVRERADAALVAQDPVLISARGYVVRRAAEKRLPAVYGNTEYVEIGGLMSYGPSIVYQFRHAATYVDRILKGARPGDLAVAQPTTFELVVNLKTAKALGLTIRRRSSSGRIG